MSADSPEPTPATFVDRHGFTYEWKAGTADEWAEAEIEEDYDDDES